MRILDAMVTHAEHSLDAEPRLRHAAPPAWSPGQLEARALELAATHTVAADPARGLPLLPRVDESAERLAETYQQLSSVARSDPQPIGAEDWIRDNYHVVQDQIREIRQDLPRRYYMELPKLESGPLAGYPRVYHVARELVGHTAGRLDMETLVEFIAAYQRSVPLSIGEIWAIPIMLRLSLVEELRELADSTLTARQRREQARRWQELAAKEKTPAQIHRLLERELLEQQTLSASFVVELLQWLRDQPTSFAPIWHALQRSLDAQGDTADGLVRAEYQREAADQLATGNVITSMRLLSAVDWSAFFDRVSLVEQVLREDPAGAYGRMDFPTRDRYRHSIEQLARRARTDELAVARLAVDMARQATAADPSRDRRHHVGYYLISRGRFLLEAELGYPPRLRERVGRFLFKHPAIGYLGLIGSTTGVMVASVLTYGVRHGATTPELWLAAALLIIPVSELAISLVNLLLTSQLAPRPLPKLEMKDGIPAADRTFVAVPAIIDTPERVRSLFHDLAVRFLANRDANLHFALLTDLPDASAQTLPGDDAVLQAAVAQVDELNARYGADRFFLFHRERRWNPSESVWMGWERKRGKLTEFNRLLRGAGDTSFVLRHGHTAVLPSVRYVITLDSDTQLPLDSACRMVGTLSHPLNRPRFDPALRRVTEGYGVLQPRVGVGIESATRTSFAAVYSGHVGVDPYTSAVSDVYQDLFHEGSFVGKGIYDVDAFASALADRVPENTLLSHDLFEGFYARTGLCTDIHVVDDYPGNYLAFASRLHRWVRGDWQLLPWLWRTVPTAAGGREPNRLPAIARWKIIDNLRRSLLPPALVALFVAGWTILPGSSVVWSSVALLVLAFPAYVQVGRSLSSRVRGVAFRDHVRAEADTLLTGARQALLSSSFLLHQSGSMLDAIARTLARVLFTRRRLLQWVTADRAAHAVRFGKSVALRLLPAPLMAVAAGILVAIQAPARLPGALPVLALWFVSPLIVYATGLPARRRHAAPEPDERLALRMVARRTWRYFDDFVTAADNWLVPDNVQENRRERIAHRTSPTNIGLQLLAILAARDFGHVTTTAAVDRLEATFRALIRMQRYRGHFYNWYDTASLAPLSPAYISTVDSGNLAGYLLTLRTGLAELTRRPLPDGTCLDGIRDAVELCVEELRGIRKGGAVREGIDLAVAALRALLTPEPATAEELQRRLVQVRERLSEIGVLLHELEEQLVADAPVTRAGTDTPSRRAPVEGRLAEITYWHEQAARLVAAQQAELQLLTPLTEGGPADPDSAGAPSTAARAIAHQLTERIEALSALADDFVEEMEFGFLFNRQRQLFAIGFSVADGRLDESHYDTLASEARLASFIAIALGAIPHAHWFKLGRSLTTTGSQRALLSWSASMFEYLMPLLVMRGYPNTLLAETYEAIVARQIRYGAQRGVPWGISESAYNTQDLEGNYQYRAFGVPGLGLKRGLADDLVIAPYATLLAALISPRDALANLRALEAEGMKGACGFYEAIDYTPERVTKGVRGVVLPTYMAHHQGMALLALDHVLNGAPMQRRFHEDPRIQSADLLLQERIPHLVPLKNPPIETAEHIPSTRAMPPAAVRRYITPHTASPRTHLLSNGQYCVALTNAGGGYSRHLGTMLTRWREDITRDDWGSFCYVRDVDSQAVWSTAFQPARQEPDEYEVLFAPDRAVFRRRDEDIEIRTEIVVSPEDPAELRRISLTNHGSRARTLELTTYAEVVLAPPGADLAHPAFSNLFVETTAVPERDALICTRRPREGSERWYLVHVLSGRAAAEGPTEYETDRSRFIGRGHTLERPLAIVGGRRLSGTTGPVLDPIVSLRRTVRIPPGSTARLSVTTAFAAAEDAARAIAEKYHDRRAVARALALASTHSLVELRHLGLTPEQTMRFQRLGGRLLYGDPRLRTRDAVVENVRTQADLWKYGISGDVPIVLVRISRVEDVGLCRELIKAHEYLRLKGLAFDLVLLNEHAASYLQELNQALLALVESSPEQAWLDRPGGVFVRRADLMPPEDRTLLRAVARVEMTAADGELPEQLKITLIPREPLAHFAERQTPRADAPRHAPVPVPPPQVDLEFFNGSGGFTGNGAEYHIPVAPARQQLPPLPWVNVVANERFGFVATERSTGYTWSNNSHDNRLTPWSNDPVRDPAGEAVFIRDEESGTAWSATPAPAGGDGAYTTRHGQGQTAYTHERDHLASTLVVSVPPDDEVKIFALTLRNRSQRPRRLSVTLYVDWVLGEHRAATAQHVVTKVDPGSGALFARNRFRQDFAGRVAFLDLFPGTARSVTGDRTEFIGRNGSLGRPAALDRPSLSNRVGAALDPCGAVQVQVTVDPGQEYRLTGLLGDAVDEERARAAIARLRPLAAEPVARAREFWDGLGGTVQVATPDRAFDLLLNRWLLYQTLSCRIWGRSAFYQSSGAYGFRDQLQDTLALVHSAPQLTRAHILKAASRQFLEGDVQHWWHEPSGRGVRTRFADDRLWLPYAALRYAEATGESALFDEQVSYLEGRPLRPDEHEAYEQPAASAVSGSLYEHCVKAIALNLDAGVHGLPLMGGGDWNDGMNMIGIGGQGESVWLAWFLMSILGPFADLAEARGDASLAATYRERVAALTAAVEEAWDGAWYRRAYFDDGTPVGSASNEECRIDAIAQSWAVIAGTASPERARQAMESVWQHLVDRDGRLVLLLTPPFDRSHPSPGYIQGYLPGVRENGGQYTHAALWTAMAFARLGDGDRAMETFSLINPINHALTADAVSRYRTEPYVVAADVYSRPPHLGRGGWTWYTGSAGWMYRVALEEILGITLKNGMLRVDPCIPRTWRGFTVDYRAGSGRYRITVDNAAGVSRGVVSLQLDGTPVSGDVPVAAGGAHEVRVVMG